MRVLFVGDGNHDIGPGDGTERPRRARGVIPILSEKVVPSISASESKSLTWREIRSFPPSGRQRRPGRGGSSGYERRARLAATIAKVRQLDAVICVVDEDGDDTRLGRLQRCRVEPDGRGSPPVPIACGAVVRTIEAWSLGAPHAIAEVLGVHIDRVRQHIPKKVETLNPNSGKPERRSKTILAKLAELGNRQDNIGFREDIAIHTNVNKLKKACPVGFAPFVKELDALERQVRSVNS